ncbi:MAG: tRNA preQ1(34) S-adenosylmethionine ribosyltransferase-isomerase QueA [Candidimonas sp.]|nr:MAG: tRNA preQ1(34) S-adenosylmethionine ribosyltransferase-isomerase QueA [Candidimonas sp.]TAM22789.1 MAG: tRNA preQ1(34) S-adenosylmethionine ribosyltransferase-isomerase QueA [Candidimonas sp.]TAM73691.1 MAG: tRNA preQ1(34) S-adenosylmethionine ribosyltransferase-isomerase QueA [Candidimonas sp.]
MNHKLVLSQFDYELPPELIAQSPAAERTGSRLLHLDAAGALHDRQFTQLPELLKPNDLLVFNDTRVIKARLRGHKESGGKVEVLIESITEPRVALAHVRASKTPRPGSVLTMAQAFNINVLGRQGELFELEFPERVLDLLDRYGSTPLPPYITHAAQQQDEERYQTVYAREPGAVAAPTAGLHFDNAMLARLAAQGIGESFVTLHVGAGTFQPVRVEHLDEHVMHSEHYSVSAQTLQQIRATRAAGGRIIAVGTTSVRALESVAQHCGLEASIDDHPVQGDTRLFITPGYRFQVIDALITNFHLPQSTLLMLISALAGMDPIRRAYAHAIQSRYRFFSYGDAMFIETPQP